MNPITPARTDFFRRRTSKELAHLLEIDFDRALVTHGDPVMKDARGGARERIGRRPLVSPPVMSDHVYKSVEITGSSPDGIQKAIDNALDKAGQTLRNLDWFEVVNIRGALQERRAPLPGDAQDRVPARIDERRPARAGPSRNCTSLGPRSPTCRRAAVLRDAV